MKKVMTWGKIGSHGDRLELCIHGSITYGMHGSGAKKKSTPIMHCDPMLVITTEKGNTIQVPVDAVIEALSLITDILDIPAVMTNRFYALPSGDRNDFIQRCEKSIIARWGWIRDRFIRR